MPSPGEITRHHEPDPDENPWVHGPPEPTTVHIVEYDSGWPERYATLAASVRDVLGDRVVDLAHVGSTSVPGLAAKDVIDIDLVVPDPRAEADYLPALERLGWRHVVREPSWHEHRGLNRTDPAANLHVFGPDSPETVRHRMFRDWLRTHPDDRELYARAKRAAVPGGGRVMDYNARKQDVVREIYDRLFRAAGLLD
ncbi:GrpB family protein [Jatrophihabitans sp. YIM 134969]